ncbi:serpin family protein [Oxynema aestuarii]|uniref:Serpin family protein n=1 Tax=Oxynema aestuarii AP17 TaxID=2064643 RepID=A0A6H1U0G4_9CYAN|nr:serpin family protein [Oxynema aestuarii]QIZ72358.1 serpin family protein [Oxynema aestuarii AP17]
MNVHWVYRAIAASIGAITPVLTSSSAIAASAARSAPIAQEERQLAQSFAEDLPADVATLVKDNNAFALDLYHHLRQQPGNLFIAPYSLSRSFAMTYAGARGQTAAEIAKVLHLSLPEPRVHEAFASLVVILPHQTEGIPRLESIDRLWGQENYPFQDPFVETIARHYQASLARIDFAKQPELARETINQWIAERSNGRIQNLLRPKDIGANTRLILTNTVYFKAQWFSPFSPQRTESAPFAIAPGQTVPVPMMYQLMNPTSIVEYDDLTLLDLPYRDTTISTVVLLPTQTAELQRVEAQITPENLQRWFSDLDRHWSTEQPLSAHIWLPKFELQSKLDLSQVLSSLGMPSAFSKSADFSGIDNSRDLYLSAAIQQTFITVNEQGTEASASSAVASGVRGAQNSTLEFRADRPFIFLIRDNTSGSLLFIGRLVNPGELSP